MLMFWKLMQNFYVVGSFFIKLVPRRDDHESEEIDSMSCKLLKRICLTTVFYHLVHDIKPPNHQSCLPQLFPQSFPSLSS